MSDNLAVRRIEQIDKHTLGIEWNDGHKSMWQLAHLRRNCPCALCVEEMTNKPLLDPNSIDDNITCSKVVSVGRYALTIDFSDGHNTGIFTFDKLRKRCQCDLCK